MRWTREYSEQGLTIAMTIRLENVESQIKEKERMIEDLLTANASENAAKINILEAEVRPLYFERVELRELHGENESASPNAQRGVNREPGEEG